MEEDEGEVVEAAVVGVFPLVSSSEGETRPLASWMSRKWALTLGGGGALRLPRAIVRGPSNFDCHGGQTAGQRKTRRGTTCPFDWQARLAWQAEGQSATGAAIAGLAPSQWAGPQIPGPHPLCLPHAVSFGLIARDEETTEQRSSAGARSQTGQAASSANA